MISESEYQSQQLKIAELLVEKRWEEALSLATALLSLGPSNSQQRELYGMRGSIKLKLGDPSEALKDLRLALRTENLTPYSEFALLISCAEASRNLNSLTEEQRYLELAVLCANADPSVCVAGCFKRLVEIARGSGRELHLSKLQKLAITQNWAYFNVEGVPRFDDLDMTISELTAALDAANRRARSNDSEE